MGIEELYSELQAHLQNERWIDAVICCCKILGVEPNYRDVPGLLKRARRGLREEREARDSASQNWAYNMLSTMERKPKHSHWPLVVILLVIGGCLLTTCIAMLR